MSFGRQWVCYGCYATIRSLALPLGWVTDKWHGLVSTRCYACRRPPRIEA